MSESKRSSVRIIGVIILCTSAIRNDDDDVIILYRVQPSELKKTKKISQTFNSSTVIPNEAPRLPLYQLTVKHLPTRLGVNIYKSDFILYYDPRGTYNTWYCIVIIMVIE